ncbi:MAG: hypothetical protein Q4F57_07990 [Weeksellaceae bacterium]|nr:hypothetical protein [Weeksellaceae bacterium]
MKNSIYLIIACFLLSACMEYADDGMPSAPEASMPEGVKKMTRLEFVAEWSMNLVGIDQEFTTTNDYLEIFNPNTFSSTVTQINSYSEIEDFPMPPITVNFEKTYLGPFLQSQTPNITINYDDNRVSQRIDENRTTSFSHSDNSVTISSPQGGFPYTATLNHQSYQITGGTVNVQAPDGSEETFDFSVTWTGNNLTKIEVERENGNQHIFEIEYDNKVNPHQKVSASNWEQRYWATLPEMGVPDNFAVNSNAYEMGVINLMSRMLYTGSNNVLVLKKNGTQVFSYNFVYDQDDHPTNYSTLIPISLFINGAALPDMDSEEDWSQMPNVSVEGTITY